MYLVSSITKGDIQTLGGNLVSISLFDIYQCNNTCHVWYENIVFKHKLTQPELIRKNNEICNSPESLQGWPTFQQLYRQQESQGHACHFPRHTLTIYTF